LTAAIHEVQGICLASKTGLAREPTRAPHLREPGFERKFDYSTLFYDVIRQEGRGPIRIIAPPLLNLDMPLKASRFASPDGARDLRFEIRTMDRQTQILVEDPGTPSLILSGPIGDYVLPVTEPDFEPFAGRRTVFTLSKDNTLVWIRDWLEYYRTIHGADAVLVYDNGSTDYSADELLAALSGVSGIEAAAVVRWPFKHGPTGSGLKKNWDSNFSQLGMMEHARWRNLAHARSVLNCDVDELVVSFGHQSIFEAAEGSWFGVVAFEGNWVPGLQAITRDGSPTTPLRFKDYRYVLSEKTTWRMSWRPFQRNTCQPKWALTPARAPRGTRWHIHYIEGWWASRLPHRQFRFRHFREISRSWKYDRTQRDRLDPSRHAEDTILMEAFSRLGWANRPAIESVKALPLSWRLFRRSRRRTALG